MVVTVAEWTRPEQFIVEGDQARWVGDANHALEEHGMVIDGYDPDHDLG